MYETMKARIYEATKEAPGVENKDKGTTRTPWWNQHLKEVTKEKKRHMKDGLSRQQTYLSSCTKSNHERKYT